jgi:alpha-1,2-mannosyltransferase
VQSAAAPPNGVAPPGEKKRRAHLAGIYATLVFAGGEPCAECKMASSKDDIYRKMTVAGAVFFVIFEIGYLFTTTPPFDGRGYVIGRDFVATWIGAKSALALNAVALFDPVAFNAGLEAMFYRGFPVHNWFYPPQLLLLIWPLGFLEYFPAYIVWCLGGMALYLWVASDGFVRRDRLPMLAVAPAAAINVFTGQIGFVTASLMSGGLKQFSRRPIVAGICFGLLSIKPQFGILLPLMLILTRRWITFAVAAGTVVVMAALVTALFGANVWSEYVRLVMPVQQDFMAHGGGLAPAMMPTVFMNARVAQLPIPVAWALQAVMSAAAVAAVCWTFWRRRDETLSIALFVTASFLVTPYAFNYDMVVFGWVIALLRERGGTLFDDRLAMLVWTLPVTTLIGLAGIPGSSPVLAAFAARLLWRLSTASETAVQPRRLATAGA